MRTSRWLLPGWLMFPALVHSLNVVDQRLPAFSPASPQFRFSSGSAAVSRWPVGLLAALLDEGPHELFGVGLKDAVDLVEEVIHALGRGRGLGLGRRRRCRNVLFDLSVAGLRLLLLLACHRYLLRVVPLFYPTVCPVPRGTSCKQYCHARAPRG